MDTAQRVVAAGVCAVAVSTIYAIQPVLDEVGGDLGLASDALGWLVAAGQIGYFAGLLLLVPLADLLDRRRLIVGHLLLTAIGTTLVALAPNAVTAMAGSAIAGFFAVVVQVTVAYAAAVSAPGERGRAIGVVTSGVVLGILGIRVLAGLLSDTVGWRAIYIVLALACVALAATARRLLRPDPRSPERRYVEILASMARLTRDRLFLGRGLVTFFVFASFGTLWSGLALPLSAAPWSLSAAAIGLFGAFGLAGALGATRAGRWADAGHARTTTGWSLVLLAASWLLLGRTEPTLLLLVVGVIALDFAVQAVHVTSQHLLTSSYPDRAGSVIGAYMAFYSLGSALGAVTTAWAYTTWGWWASCLTGAVYAVAALATHLLSRTPLPALATPR
ncbi:MFS transporter [Nocardia neocaledoniensis NBRC 108232]|uniref:Putative MFS family arabinose efflux permease n=1 Tax=Nocardia neocaledoniensis TaxID=236511 RepID=A0A317N9C3_9NOCA|nr:putative MFS family arabinose efflux permease [Nocardia neocaledoniensis]GEM30869.1 MFS transporter [Nocardia neocaledoniensis NBRC 108232]